MSDLNVKNDKQAAIVSVALMNQVPGGPIQGQSPLYHAELDKLAKHNPQSGGIVIRERMLLGHLSLRCNQYESESRSAVETVLGIQLPLVPLTSIEKGAYSIRWISPDEWLIVVPGSEVFDIESQLRENLIGHFSLVNGSGGFTVIELSGHSVFDLLKKCVSVDLHPNHFPIGKVVSTTFAKSTAVVRRTGEQHFELVIRRSFADYVWLWLQDASSEFGLVVDH